MRSLDRAPLVVRALADEGGMQAAHVVTSLATGLGIGALVARTFVEMNLRDGVALAIPLGLGWLAATCTSAGTFMGLRAPTIARSVVWTVLSNVGPPSLVCLPTILGLVYSVPAGILAALLVLPAVLGARAVTRTDSPGSLERASLVAAAFLLVSGAGNTLIDFVSAPTSAGWALTVAPIAVATGLVAYVLARSAIRFASVVAIEHGLVPDHSTARDRDELVRVSRSVDAGDGPHRRASLTDCIAELRVPWARAAWSSLLLVIGAVLVVARLATLCG